MEATHVGLHSIHTCFTRWSTKHHNQPTLVCICYLFIYFCCVDLHDHWINDEVIVKTWVFDCFYFWAHNGIDQFLGTVGTMALGPLICFINYYVENAILKMTYILKKYSKENLFNSLLRSYCFGDDIFLKMSYFSKSIFYKSISFFYVRKKTLINWKTIF